MLGSHDPAAGASRLRRHPGATARQRPHDRHRRRCRDHDRAGARGALDGRRPVAAHLRRGARRPRPRRRAVPGGRRAPGRAAGRRRGGRPHAEHPLDAGPRRSHRAAAARRPRRGADRNAPVRTDGSGPARRRRGARAQPRARLRARRRLDGARGRGRLAVVGLAIVPSQPRYPRCNPGVAWVTRPTFERIATDRAAWRWREAVRLADPAGADAFAARASATSRPASPPPGSSASRPGSSSAEEALRDAEPVQLVVTVFGALLLADAFVVVGILVGARPPTSGATSGCSRRRASRRA